MKDFDSSCFEVKIDYGEIPPFSMIGKYYPPGRDILSLKLLPCVYAPEREEEEKSFFGKITERWKKIKGKLKNIKPL